MIRKLLAALAFAFIVSLPGLSQAQGFKETPGIEIGPSSCSLYPLAISHDLLAGAEPGARLTALAGHGPGNFGWVSWDGATDANTLAASLIPPGNSETYVDPDGMSARVSVGGWVQGGPGVMNSKNVRDRFDALLNKNIIVPVFAGTRRQGGDFDYRVFHFAVISPTAYRFSGQGYVSFDFVRYTRCYNVRPIAFDQSLQTKSGVPLSIELRGHDDDGDTLAFEILTPPVNGSLEGEGAKRIYRPAAGFVGQDRFTFAVNDGEQRSNVATVLIDVLRSNQPPEIVSTPPLTALNGQLFSYPVRAVDPDPDDELSYSLIDGPAGSVIDPATGVLQWPVSSEFFGHNLLPNLQCAVSAGAADRAGYADVVFAVDESGSMSGEHAWIKEFVYGLESHLLSNEVGSGQQRNLYGLIGYEARPRPLPVGGAELGGYREMAAAASQLRISGGTEDGYAAIKHAIAGYTLRAESAKNVVLITDEDRDVVDTSIDSASMLALLRGQSAILNSVVDARFRCGDGRAALGMGQGGTGFVADGAGGYSVCVNASAVSGSGTTIRDYVDLALATGGAAWDLQFLRSGGANAMSFSRALTTVKVQEIVESLPPAELPDLALGSVRYADSQLLVDVINRGRAAHPATTTLTAVVSGQAVASGEVGPLAAGESQAVALPLAELGAISAIQLQLPGHAGEAECVVLNNERSLPWFRVRVTDRAGLYDEQTFLVDPLDSAAGNRPPVIESEPPTLASVGARYRYPVLASDPDIGDALRYRLLAGPAGMFLDDLTGVLSFSPRAGQVGQHVVTVEVADLHGAAVSQTFTLTVSDDYLPPRFTSTPPLRAIQAQPYRYTTTVSADPSALLAYHVVHGPEGAGMDAAGVLSWEVPAAYAGKQEVVILRVRDQFGNYDLQMFTLYGDIPNAAPRISSSPGLTATVGSTYSYSARAQDANHYERHSWHLDQGPGGMTVNAETGQLSWPGSQVGAPHLQALVLENGACRVSDPRQPLLEARRVLQNSGPRAVTQPLVGPLFDDNGDGRLDAEDDIAAVYVARGGTGFSGNWVHALDLRSGRLIWSVNERAPKHQVAPVLADLAGTGEPSIVYLDESHHLVALDGRGKVRWVSDSPAIAGSLNTNNSGIVLADLEGQGRLSLLYGPSVFDAEGKLRWQFIDLAGNHGSRGQGMPHAVDLTGDGLPELAYHNQVRSGDGALLWQTPSVRDATVYHANFASADLDGDGYPELIISERTSRGYRLSAVNRAGEALWTRQGGDIVAAGPVIAADFDGDGKIEIFSPSNMALFDAEGGLIWSRSDLVRTLFRNALAADLDGDGQLELVVQQGAELRVLAAASGSLLTRWSWPDNGSAPANQVPVLVKPFADSRARVIVGGSGGLAVFASAVGADWLASNPTFNHQEQRVAEFSATHGWLGSSAPARVQHPAVAGGAPTQFRADLHISAPTGSAVDQGALALAVTVRNNGLAPMPAGSTVVLYRDSIAEANRLGMKQLGALAPRGSVQLDFGPLPVSELGETLLAEVMPPRPELECEPDNNLAASRVAALRVVDLDGAESRQHWALGVIDRVLSPVFTLSLPRNAPIGQVYEQTLSATDPNLADAVYLRLLAGPDNMTLDPYSGKLRWTPRSDQVGNHTVQIDAVDLSGRAVARSATVTAVAPGNNQAPVIDSEPVFKAVVGQDYLYRVQAVDADGDPLQFDLIEGPAGMQLHARTGTVRWRPLSDQVLETEVTVRVRDPYGAEDRQSFVIRIEGANQPPVIRSVPPQQAVVGALYRYAVDAYDPEGETVSLTLRSAPAGVSWDAAAGALTWTPAPEQLGLQAFVVEARDPQGATATQSFQVAVNWAPNEAPRIVSAPQAPAIVGQQYRYQVQAVDEDGDVLAYSLPQGAPGMSIDEAGLLTWTPTAAGSHVVEVRVEDSRGGWATQTFTLQAVEPDSGNAPPSITSTPPMVAVIGDSYSYRVQAHDPDGDLLTFSLRQGPAGMQIDSASGLLTWEAAAEGTHPVVVRVSDGRAWAEQSFSLRVEQRAPLAVELLIEPGTVDVGDTVTIQARVSGGVPPRSTRLYIDSELQTLDANRQLVLVARQPGRYDVYVEVVDEFERASGFGHFRVRDSEDVTPPTVAIEAPVDGSVITEPVDIIGTVSDLNLVEYRLRIAPARTAQFSVIAVGNHEVSSGVLGRFDPSTLRNGLYDVELVAVDLGGHESWVKTTYEVAGNLKTGHFSVSFDDLTVPLAGLPITVTRTYDSRDRAQSLDFGYGWSIGFRSLRLQENLAAGRGWQINNYGGTFGQRCVESNGDRIVTITMPDGKQERFVAEASPRCSQLVPTIDVHLVYKPLGGSGAKLEQLDYGILRLANNDLIDLTEPGAPVDPRNYRLTTAAGEVYVIDQNFGVRQLTDLNGNTVTFSQNGIQHSSGVGISFRRDGTGRIVAIEGPDRQPVRYDYGAAGDLVTHHDRAGYQTRFTYSGGHYLEEIIDPRGVRAIRNEYDAQGRLVAQIGPNGERIEVERNLESRTEIVRDARGNATVYLYDERGNVVSETNPLGETVLRSYDSRDNLLSQTDPLGNTTTWTYDARGNKLTETDPLGRTTTWTYNARNQVLTEIDPQGRLVVSNRYDSNGNPTRLTDALGNATELAYDGRGNMARMVDAAGGTISYLYDSKGNQTRLTAADGSVTDYTYDVSGNVLTESTTRTVDGRQETLVTSYRYDANGNRIEVTDPLGNVARTEYNAIGKVSAQIDPLGRRTEYAYDARGNLVLTTHPDGTTETAGFDANGNKVSETDRAGRTTYHEYDAANRLVRTVYPDGTTTTQRYDGSGRLVESVDQAGNATRYGYDAAGHLITEHDPVGNVTRYGYDSAGNRTSVTDANGHTTTFEYDAAGRLIRTVYPDGTASSAAYDAIGRKIAETDANGHTTAFEYDSAGRLTAVIDALGQRTEYGYDSHGNRVTQTDAEGRITRWSYDGSGRVLSRTLPGGEAETFSYDAVGNRLSHTDFNGRTTAYAYDELNREVLRTYGDGSSVSTAYTASGLVATVSDAAGVTHHEYDLMDRLVRLTDPAKQVITYGYDARGNRVTLSSGSHSISFSYNPLNQLESVTDANGTVRYQYDPVGNLTLIRYPNGLATTQQYDRLNRLVEQTTRNAANTVVERFRYTLGDNGERLRLEELGGRVSRWSYDALYRLTEERVEDPQGGVRISRWTFDKVGNRLSEEVDGVVTTYQYDANDRLLRESGGRQVSYQYDANGNTIAEQTAKGSSVYSYDDANRLIAAATPTASLSFSYDASGIRRSRTENGVTTRYLVDPNRAYAQVLSESIDGVEQVRYTHGHHLLSQRRGGELRYFHQDGLGSTRALSDAAGTLTDHYAYHAYGELDRQTGSTANAYLFTGEQYDAGLGHYYLRARYYNPAIGRFPTMDTYAGRVGEPITLHKYIYANANPVSNVDPGGQFALPSVSLSMGNIATLSTIAIGGFTLANAIADSRPDGRFALWDALAANYYRSAIASFRVAKMIVAVRVWNGRTGPQKHHPIPFYLCGVEDQILSLLPHEKHVAVHATLASVELALREAEAQADRHITLGGKRSGAVLGLARTSEGRKVIALGIREAYLPFWNDGEPSLGSAFEDEERPYINSKHSWPECKRPW